jgi:hypothetical protein
MEISNIFILLLLFAVLGGALAFLGDVLGRRVGKLRLRIGKMRPKHTAVLFTVLTGALIPILTTLGIMAASADVRQWVSEGPRLVVMRDQLRTDLGRMKEETDKISLQNVALQKDIEQGEGRYAALTEQNRTAEQTRKELNARVTSLTAQERSLSTQLNSAKSDLAAAVQDKVEQEERLSSLKAQNEDLNEQSISLTQQVIASEKQLSEARAKEQTATTAASEAEARLESLQDTLAILESERRSRESRLFELAQESIKKQNELDSVKRQLDNITSEFGSLLQSAQIFRTSPVLFERGDELARTTLTGGADETASRRGVDWLIGLASDKARKGGASPPDQPRAANLQDRQFRRPDGSIANLTPDDQIAAYVDAVARAEGEIVLIASSFYNYYGADSEHNRVVPLDIAIFRNAVVYRKGEFIGSGFVDGAQNEAEIALDIMALLDGPIQSAALQKGVIRIQGGASIIAPLSVRDFALLVAKIRQLDSQAVIEVYAAEAAKAGDKVLIEIQFRRRI